MKKVVTLIFIVIQTLLFGQINININASRTTGTAPLYVFFDATASTGINGTNELVNSDFSWNFDSTNTGENSWEITKGMVAGHVFETPGIYTVECVSTDPNGNTTSETIEITVTLFQGTTYYVASNGNDANDGLTESTAWATADFALDQLTSNQRILFRRGDIFTKSYSILENLQAQRIHLGAYGIGEKPIINGQLPTNPSVIPRTFFFRNSNDIVLENLHLIPVQEGASRNLLLDEVENFLLLNVELEASRATASVIDDSNLVGIFNCNYHDFNIMALYSGETNRLSFVGNIINELDGTPQPEHGVRIQGGEKQFIAHNILTNLIDTKTGITIRGDGQRHVMIFKNKMDRLLGVNPQNAATFEAISEVCIEANYIGHNVDYVGQSFPPSNNGINIEASNIAIRNNVVDGYRNAIFVGRDHDQAPPSGSVDIYHNTINWRPVSPQSLTGGRLVTIRDVFDVTVMNNVISAPNQNNAEEVVQLGTNTGILSSSNITTTSPNYSSNPLPDSAADLNDISNYYLTNSSPMLNQGENTVPVFFDADNTNRPIDTHKDIGAFEYIDNTLAVEEFTKNDIVIYPNPANDIIIIKATESYDSISIIDLHGKSVYTSKKVLSSIDVSFLGNGIYFVRIGNNQNFVMKKIIKK